MEQIQSIPIKDVHPHPDNRKIGGFDKTKLGQLADSIRVIGVQQPAVVRRRTEGGYELVAGERRWRASKIAGVETLPCVVREIDDLTLLKIQTIENLQREDVHPLDEAEGFKRLMEVAGMTADQVAKEVGQTRSYIYHRLKLCSIDDEVREALVKDRISVGHAELVARLPGHRQGEALKMCFGGTWTGVGHIDVLIPLKDVRKMIAQELFLELDAASFKKDDAELIEDAGSCTTCPKRTGYVPELFPELKEKDHCTDPACYNAKINAAVQKKREELQQKGEDFVEVRGDYGDNPECRNAVQRYNWQECRKKDPEAKKILIVSGTDKGRVTYGRVAADPEEEGDQELKWAIDRARNQNKQNCDTTTKKRLFEEINARYREKLDDWEISREELVIVAKRFYQEIWAEFQKELCKAWDWEYKGSGCGNYLKKIPSLSFKELLLFIIDCSMVRALNPYAGESDNPIKEYAGIIGIDSGKIIAETKAEYTEKLKKRKAVLRKKFGRESAA